jgi:hypothetical protein
MGDLNEDKALAVFDQLVLEGVLIYGPHQSVVREAEGYPVSLSRQTKLTRGLCCARVVSIQSVRAPVQETTHGGRQTQPRLR